MMDLRQGTDTVTPVTLAPAPTLGALRAGALVDASILPALIADQMRGALRVRQVVAAAYGLPVTALLTEGRTREVAEARQVAMYLMRQGLYWPTLRRVRRNGQEVTVLRKRPFPWQRIAGVMERDHSTVMHSWQVIARRRAARADMAYTVTALIAILRRPPDRGKPAAPAQPAA